MERITREEVAAMWPIHKDRVYSLIHSGQIPAGVRFGHRMYWYRSDIEKAIARRMKAGGIRVNK